MMQDNQHYTRTIVPLIGEGSQPAIQWLMTQGLLASDVCCKHCNTRMALRRRQECQDGILWTCTNNICLPKNTTRSIRTETFFTASNLKLQQWIHVIYLWSIGENQKNTVKLSGVSKRSMVKIYKSLREVCGRYFYHNPIRLGGPGRVCQLDESQFTHKVKHHRGRAPQNVIWVFGIVDISMTPGIGFMRVVENRSADTLLPIIQEVIRAGTTIHSDQWRGYINLQRDLGFAHQTVNHSLYFVDPSTGVHTQNIESYWNKHKIAVRSMKGICSETLSAYLDECMWRDRFNSTAFSSICNHIVRYNVGN